MNAHAQPGLELLARDVRRDLARLNFPPANWVLPMPAPDGKPPLDVLIVGAGMCGQTAAFALLREGIPHFRIIDRAGRGQEGPWGTYARMQTLRSPKHVNGPDLGVPSLTFRAWYEAQNGAAGWDALYKIGRQDWLAYLLWVRDTLGLPVENDTELRRFDSEAGLVRAEIHGPRGPETLYARKIVLASGRDGSGGKFMPAYPSLTREASALAGTIHHSADDIDFARLQGRRIAVVGASASAFDNAAVALENGAAAVVMFSRRPFMPQVNKSRWASFQAFQRGFGLLDDATRWRFLSHLHEVQAPPPFESVLRCEQHSGFSLRFDARISDVAPDETGALLTVNGETEHFDAVVFATGFSVDVPQRPELAPFAARIALWGDRVSTAEAAAHPDLARFPYLDAGFALTGKGSERDPFLASTHLFNYGATLSHWALTGDVPGLATGATRLAQAIAQDLLSTDIEQHHANMLAYEEPELKPTPYYVAPEDRPALKRSAP